MSSADAEKRKSDAHGLGRLRGKARHIVFFAFALLLFLALVSHNACDPELLAGGVKGEVIHNLIGRIGARTAWFLLLVFGLAVYPGALLLLLSAIRRLFLPGKFKPMSWPYWLALLLVICGISMFLGLYPDFASGLTAALNIRRIPGGVVGQRLCDPSTGCMQVMLNMMGTGIVSLAIAAVGVTVIWLDEWHDFFCGTVLPRLTGPDSGEDPQKASGKAGVFRRKAGGKKKKAKKRKKRKKRKKKPSVVERREKKLRERGKEASDAPAPKATGSIPKQESGNTGTRRKSTRTVNKEASYVRPGLDLLIVREGEDVGEDDSEIERKKVILQDTLDSFGIDAEVGDATFGPRVTLLEVLTAPGVKVEKISQISNNIAMELRATSLRILTPIPGKKSVGIEVPNSSASMVGVHNLMASRTWKKTKAAIPLLMGRDIAGKVVVLDLAQAPHLLIAGATGSGKSVCINLLVMSLLYRFSPDELRMIMIDPKVVEFRPYESLPHLVVPVISDTKRVPLALRWVIREMEHRYQVLARVNARNIEAFNSRPKSPEVVEDEEGNPIPEKLPYVVVVVDELADIMMTAKSDVENSLARIAQLSRAVGIHTIIATQRPSVNVITGIIKANFPTRIAFKVTSQVDSRTILDGKGAEALLGRGDMLFRPPGSSGLKRIQGGMVQDEELERVVEFVSGQRSQDFDDEVLQPETKTGAGPGGGALSAEDESLVQDAMDVIIRDRRATTSYVQRALRIGYNRAAMVMDVLEEREVVGPQIGSSPREILVLSSDDGNEDDGESQDESGEDPADAGE